MSLQNARAYIELYELNLLSSPISRCFPIWWYPASCPTLRKKWSQKGASEELFWKTAPFCKEEPFFSKKRYGIAPPTQCYPLLTIESYGCDADWPICLWNRMGQNGTGHWIPPNWETPYVKMDGLWAFKRHWLTG